MVLPETFKLYSIPYAQIIFEVNYPIKYKYDR